LERKDAEREKNLKGYQVLLRKRNPTKLKSEKYHDVKWQKASAFKRCFSHCMTPM